MDDHTTPDESAASALPIAQPRDGVEAPDIDRATTRQQERLASVGEQVARVAHEMNKPAALIAGSLEGLEQHLPVLVEALRTGRDGAGSRGPQDGLAYALENVPTLVAVCREGVDRMRRILAQLASFTRGREECRTAGLVEIDPLVRRAITWASRARAAPPPPVSCRIAPLPPVHGDAEALTEALVNVLANAFDALSSTPEPRVHLVVRPADDGRSVEIRIRDNGPGIDPRDRAHVFQPFFTTKGTHAGLGLGLSIARDIVESAGGTLTLGTRRSAGAEFVIRLPAEPARAGVAG